MVQSLLTFLVLALGAAATDSWPHHTFATGPWQPPKLEIDKLGDVDPGYIFLGSRGPIDPEKPHHGGPTIYDKNGDLVYMGTDNYMNIANFRKQKLFGQDVLTFWSGILTPPGYGLGAIYILDNEYNEIHAIKVNGDIVTPDGKPRDSYIDVHESFITPWNTILVSTINVTQHDLTSIGGSPDMYMVDNIFYEVDVATKNVVFSWSALENVPIEHSKTPLGDSGNRTSPWDPYHINTIIPTKDGYLVNLRWLSSAFYLNRDGSIRWQLSGIDGDGDFNLEDGNFSWGHQTIVYNETDESLVLSLFNDAIGKFQTDGESTGLLLHVDLTTHSVSTLRNVSDPTDSIQSFIEGGVQLLGPDATSHMLVGYGVVPKFKEFDGQGNVAMSVEYGYEGSPHSYRVFKNSWTTTPPWKPAVVARRASGEAVDVFMSWNGATEYDSWAVYFVPGDNEDHSTLVTSAARAGFETKVTLRDIGGGYIRVVAKGGDISLGVSDIMEIED